MYGNDCSITTPSVVGTHFSLREVCGRWISLCGSPEVRIFFTGTRFRLEFSYDTATVFTCPIRWMWGVTFFYLYGRIRMNYDAGREVLMLSDYGEYIRADED